MSTIKIQGYPPRGRLPITIFDCSEMAHDCCQAISLSADHNYAIGTDETGAEIMRYVDGARVDPVPTPVYHRRQAW